MDHKREHRTPPISNEAWEWVDNTTLWWKCMGFEFLYCLAFFCCGLYVFVVCEFGVLVFLG